MEDDRPARHSEGTEAPPTHPGRDEEADQALGDSIRQEERTSLEGDAAARTVDELAEGAERATRRPGFGREGS